MAYLPQPWCRKDCSSPKEVLHKIPLPSLTARHQILHPLQPKNGQPFLYGLKPKVHTPVRFPTVFCTGASFCPGFRPVQSPHSVQLKKAVWQLPDRLHRYFQYHRRQEPHRHTVEASLIPLQPPAQRVPSEQGKASRTFLWYLYHIVSFPNRLPDISSFPIS